MPIGLMDYYYQTGSVRIVDVLLKTNPQHIFDRLLDWLKASSHKLPALALLGHIISKHPTWLYQLERHAVFREIFRILNTEVDVIPEMSALLCIITLLAKIPYLMKNHLDELFAVFSHLASWNNHRTAQGSSAAATAASTTTFKAPSADQLEHLQIGLYIYFQRLYGMFPCNFMEYLKRVYTTNSSTPDKGAIFTHTILPLFETVRMHPKLITDTLETEISEQPWRKVAAHDVITQCSRLSVDSCDNHQSQASHHDHQQCGAGISCHHHILEVTQTNRFELKSLTPSDHPLNPPPYTLVDNYWTPSQMAYLPSPLPSSVSALQQSAPPSVTSLVQSSPANIQKHMQKNLQFVGGLGGTSPPEAAVEATPETTPMNDLRRSQAAFPPQNSSAVRAIGLGALIGGNSQPSSPLKKPATTTTFRYPPEQNTVEHAIQRMIKLQLETNAPANTDAAANSSTSIPSSPLPIAQQMSSSSGGGGVVSGISNMAKEREHYTHTKQQQKVEPELAKFELSQSPCNVGGLHMPNSRSIQEFKEISMHHNERDRKESVKSEAAAGEGAKAIAAQPEALWNSSAAYDHMLVDLSKEAKRDGDGAVCEIKRAVAPKEILDKIIEKAIAKKDAQNAKDLEEYYKNHILLLSYQLNFERQQREMTAERNRRLFGSDKDYK